MACSSSSITISLRNERFGPTGALVEASVVPTSPSASTILSVSSSNFTVDFAPLSFLLAASPGFYSLGLDALAAFVFD